MRTLHRTRRGLRRSFVGVGTAAALAVGFFIAPMPVAVGAVGDTGSAVAFDRSAPLSSYPSAPETDEAKKGKKVHRDKRDLGLPQKAKDLRSDSALQGAPSAAVAAPVASGFEGVGGGLAGFTVNSAPPDPSAAVGPTDVVQTVNSGFAVFTKSGSVRYGPVATNTLWTNFSGPCQTTNDGDAVVRYDRAGDRWIITQFANTAAPNGPYYECLAVSATGDPTGSYNRYAFQYANFPDYPKLGVWPDAYYMTYNLFNGNTFVGAEACAMDRAKMLAGQAAGQQCFTTSNAYGGLLPIDNAGASAPPADEPAMLLALGGSASTLAAWKFHVDWASPANSTFTGPTNVSTAAFAQACNGGTCIPQPATSNQLDSLADRLMYHLSYRNNAGTESIVLTHSVVAGNSVGVRWYELRNPAAPTIYQQGTWAPDGDYRWMGSAAMDKSGGIAMGYSTSSATSYPSIRYTARSASDTPGTMTAGEGTLISGGGSQTGTLSRWGDYASMNIDPADDCTFWFTSEYLANSGTFNWHTRIGHFTLPSCGATVAVASDFTLTTNPTSGLAAQGASTTATIFTAVSKGTTETVNLSVGTLPTGVTATFNPTSVTTGGSSTMTLAASATTPTGTYPITVTGTSPSATHTATYNLTVTAAPSSYVPLSPARVMDTRSGYVTVDGVAAGSGALGPGGRRSLPVAGRGGVPSSGVGAVVLNVTGVSPSAATFLTVFPSGEALPVASNLNLEPGQVAANLVAVKLAADGSVTLYNNTGSTDVVVDVAGYYPTGNSYAPLSPGRLLDTRAGSATVDGQFAGGGPVRAGAVLNVTVTGRVGIPTSGVSAVVLNLTGVAPTAATYVSEYPTGSPTPNASTLNLTAGKVAPNLVIAKVGAGGQVSLTNAVGAIDLVADVAGWIPDGTTYTALTPARFLDTRAGAATFDGVGAGAGPVGPGGTIQVAVTGRDGIPVTASAVVVNITAVGPSAGTYVTAYPAGAPLPNASTLNLSAGEVRPNLTIVKLGAGGKISLYNAQGNTDLLGDVIGWYDGG